MDHCCIKMEGALEEFGTPLSYVPYTRSYDMKYDIVFQDKETGKDAAIVVEPLIFCPWCGKKLPKNLFDEWVQIVENQFKVNTLDNKEIKKLPKEYTSEEWWKKRGL